MLRDQRQWQLLENAFQTSDITILLNILVALLWKYFWPRPLVPMTGMLLSYSDRSETSVKTFNCPGILEKERFPRKLVTCIIKHFPPQSILVTTWMFFLCSCRFTSQKCQLEKAQFPNQPDQSISGRFWSMLWRSRRLIRMSLKVFSIAMIKFCYGNGEDQRG